MLIPTLESERLKYIPLSLNELSGRYVEWLNDVDVNTYLETKGDYSLEKLEVYLRTVEEKPIFFWAIYLKSDKIHIGNIKIDPVDFINKTGEYGILIGDKGSWGKGYAKEATQTIIDYFFNVLEFKDIVLGVVSGNVKALSLYKKLNFVEYDILKDYGIYDNCKQDVIRMKKENYCVK